MLLRNVIAPIFLGLTAISNADAGTMGAAAPDESARGIYVEANVGYANHPWQNDRTTTVGLENQLGVLTDLSNINGGAIGGVDVGYQFTRYLALEGGWSYIPTAHYSRDQTVELQVAQTTFILPEGLLVDINSGLAYFAAKGNMPVYGNVDAFGKIGLAYAYNHTNVNVPASLVDSPAVYTSNHSNFWNPLFAFGLQYATLNNWSFNAQYAFVPGYRDASADHFITPDIQTITLGLGYKFFV
jgi:opacity protein-like surface antigen